MILISGLTVIPNKFNSNKGDQSLSGISKRNVCYVDAMNLFSHFKPKIVISNPWISQVKILK